MGATIENTYGAMLLGAFLACCLSGIVTVQSFLYIKLYPSDATRTKLVVAVVWLLDTLHTCSVVSSIWHYLIPHFRDVLRVDFIPWTLAMSVAITAVLTIIVQCFLVWRIYRLTKNDWRIAGPIFILALLKLGAACVSTAEMIRLNSFTEFVQQFQWVFTLGLSLSSVVDVMITACLCYYLHNQRTGSLSTNDIIDSLLVYTFEAGSLTCAGTVLSLILWLTMPDIRVFLTTYFMIAKLYANSLLATLNTRKTLHESRFKALASGDHVLPVIFPEYSVGRGHRARGEHSRGSETSEHDAKLEIRVHRTFDTRLDDVDRAMPATVRIATPDFKT
ncbi:hypothetical protein PILCRDRAFT_820523 [Piloderma croceum F 1598]|uniref:DUF6534 domain-containing protein n=1 Tax=Piloderma croceum (strain F 1598) TaxID=765440 RepID=A0A0C3B7D3_PILCF|nr:hypothetical protein PILCRDRAFT_820523 [Piloderma croceum F 1598]